MAHLFILFNSFQIHETIETINQLKTQREFMLNFARDPQGFINDWLQSQCRDLKVSPAVPTESSWHLKHFYLWSHISTDGMLPLHENKQIHHEV